MADGSGETAQQHVAGTGQKPPKAAPRIIEKKQNASRLRLHVAAEKLYPEDYDFSIIFDTVENRKLRHKMEKRHVEDEALTVEE